MQNHLHPPSFGWHSQQQMTVDDGTLLEVVSGHVCRAYGTAATTAEVDAT